MNALLPFAETMLCKYDEFHPFGGYLSPAAEVVHVGVEAGLALGGAAGRVEVLVDTFRRLADQGEAIAFGIATDVRLAKEDGTKTDAVRIFLEHRTGFCADVFFRYELRDGALEITDTTAQQGDPMIWRHGRDDK